MAVSRKFYDVQWVGTERKAFLGLGHSSFFYFGRRGMLLCHGCVQQRSFDKHLHWRHLDILDQGRFIEESGTYFVDSRF